MLYELLKSSPRLEQVQTVLLDWGVEQLYGLLLNGSFGDEVRERVFRVRGGARRSSNAASSTLCRNLKHTRTRFCLFQVLYKILKSERVSEFNKQRVKLKDFGYLGPVCFLEELPVTMTTVRCLYEQVLATGQPKTATSLSILTQNCKM